jgi:hypothetical protein
LEHDGLLSTDEIRQIRSAAAEDPQEFVRRIEQVRLRVPDERVWNELWRSYRFDTPPAPAHELIVRLEPRVVLTTNFDTLLEDAHARYYGRAAHVYTHEDAQTVLRKVQADSLHKRMLVMKIFGSISDPLSTVLSDVSYRNTAVYSTDLMALLERLFLTTVVLILGYSLRSPELNMILSRLSPVLPYKSVPTYALVLSRETPDVEVAKYRTDFGVEVLRYRPSEGYPEVVEFLDALLRARGIPTEPPH